MCFFTSQSVRAEEIAGKYGRGMKIVDAARRTLAAKERLDRSRYAAGEKVKADFYSYHLSDGMYVSPAYSEPYTVIVSGSSELQVMRWGLVPHTATVEAKERYAKENLFKNAKSENIFTSWPWRLLWRYNRCIIPVTGFFEPHYTENGRNQPYYIQMKGGGIFSVAALYDSWNDPHTGESLLSFVMITVPASPKLREVHNGGAHPFRMPLIIPDDRVEGWLDPGMTGEEKIATYLVTPDDSGIETWPVRKKFNYGDPFDPSIIDPVKSEDAQPKLF